MVALILLTAGVGSLLGTAVLTTRLVIRGRQAGRVAQVSSGQIEILRGQALGPPTTCAVPVRGVDSLPDGTSWQWQVEAAGVLRQASVVVTAPVPGGRATDTLTTAFWCP